MVCPFRMPPETSGRRSSRPCPTESRLASLSQRRSATALHHNGPNHLGFERNALPAHQTALITSDAGKRKVGHLLADRQPWWLEEVEVYRTADVHYQKLLRHIDAMTDIHRIERDKLVRPATCRCLADAPRSMLATLSSIALNTNRGGVELPR